MDERGGAEGEERLFAVLACSFQAGGSGVDKAGARELEEEKTTDSYLTGLAGVHLYFFSLYIAHFPSLLRPIRFPTRFPSTY